MTDNTGMPRIGLLVPASNTTMEWDFANWFAGRASVHTGRMLLREVTPEGEQEMLDVEARPAMQRVATVDPHVVVWGCTSAGSLHGADYDHRFRRDLSELGGGVPVIGVVDAVIARLEGVGRIGLLTPYVPALTDRVADRLAEAGFSVAARHSMGLSDNREIGSVTPAQVRAAALTMDLTEAEALFVSCTNLRSMEAVAGIEDALGMMVTTSNLAAAQEADRLARERAGADR